MRARVVSSIGVSLALHAGGLVVLSMVAARGVPERALASQAGLREGFVAIDRAVLVPLTPPVEPARAETPPPPPPPPPPPTPPAPPPPEPEELESPLGIENGAEAALAWKGAEVATENLAPKSKVDQAARAIDPRAGQKDAGPEVTHGSAGAAVVRGEGGGDGGGAPAEAGPPGQEQAGQATPERQEPEQHEPPRLEVEQPKPEQIKPEQLKPEQPKPEQAEERQPEAVERGVADLLRGLLELARPQERPRQEEERQPQLKQPEPEQPRPEQPEPVQEPGQRGLHERAPAERAPNPGDEGGKGGGGAVGVSRASSPDAEPGTKADEESPAASIEGSLVFKPGEPLAGKGLRVWTVTPKYAVTTRYLARPKNAVVLITFGRDGKVKRAVFKERTGYEDVDKPLLEAVYRWTARGEALNKIPAENPGAGVTYSIKFLMEAY